MRKTLENSANFAKNSRLFSIEKLFGNSIKFK